MTKKNRKTPSKKSSSSSVDSGISIDSGELAAESPLHDVTSAEFELKFTPFLISLGVNMPIFEELNTSQQDLIKSLTVATTFDPMLTYMALSLMRPALKDSSTSSHQAPCSAAQRSADKIDVFIEGLPQRDLSELISAFIKHETLNEQVVEALNKVLIQAGLSVTRIINSSTDQILSMMGASLPTMSLLEHSPSSIGGGHTTWYASMESDKVENEMAMSCASIVRTIKTGTPRPLYSPPATNLSDINPHESAMMSPLVLSIVAKFNSNAVAEIVETGQVRERTVVALNVCLLAQRAFTSLITTVIHRVAKTLPWGTVTLSKLADDRRNPDRGRTLLLPTSGNSLCMLLNNQVPSEALQCLKTLWLSFPSRSVSAYAPALIAMLQNKLAASGASAILAVLDTTCVSLENMMATTTSPALLQIGDAFLSKDFKLLILTDFIQRAQNCPSIEGDPVRIAEWGTVAEHIASKVFETPEEGWNYITGYFDTQIRHGKLTASNRDEFPAPDLSSLAFAAVTNEPADTDEPAATESTANDVPVKRDPVPHVRAGKSIADYDKRNGTNLVTRAPDGNYYLTVPGPAPKRIWFHFNSFEKACYHALREIADNGGAATNGGALEARGGVVEDSRPPRPPPVRTQLNAPIAPAPRPQPSAPIVAETPMLPVPPAPLPVFGNQAQMDAMMSTLQAQSEILRRTQEQQATTMTSMAFLADTLKALNENTRVQVQINEDEGDLDSCD